MLWSYPTTTRINMGETPFSLAFNVKTVIPLGIEISSFHTAAYSEKGNQMALQRKLDLVEEKRNDAELGNAPQC